MPTTTATTPEKVYHMGVIMPPNLSIHNNHLHPRKPNNEEALVDGFSYIETNTVPYINVEFDEKIESFLETMHPRRSSSSKQSKRNYEEVKEKKFSDLIDNSPTKFFISPVEYNYPILGNDNTISKVPKTSEIFSKMSRPTKAQIFHSSTTTRRPSRLKISTATLSSSSSPLSAPIMPIFNVELDELHRWFYVRSTKDAKDPSKRYYPFERISHLITTASTTSPTHNF